MITNTCVYLDTLLEWLLLYIKCHFTESHSGHDLDYLFVRDQVQKPLIIQRESHGHRCGVKVHLTSSLSLHSLMCKHF